MHGVQNLPLAGLRMLSAGVAQLLGPMQAAIALQGLASSSGGASTSTSSSHGGHAAFAATKRGYRQRRRAEAPRKSRAFQLRASEFVHAQEHVLNDSQLSDDGAWPMMVHSPCSTPTPGSSPSRVAGGFSSISAQFGSQDEETWMLSLALNCSML